MWTIGDAKYIKRDAGDSLTCVEEKRWQIYHREMLRMIWTRAEREMPGISGGNLNIIHIRALSTIELNCYLHMLTFFRHIQQCDMLYVLYIYGTQPQTPYSPSFSTRFLGVPWGDPGGGSS